MIIAIEGPDGSGKSTVVTHLSRLLPSVKILQFRHTPAAYLEYIEDLEPVVFSLFEQMYDPASVYICDRFFSVTSRVYAEGRGGECPIDDFDAWVMPELHIILLKTPLEMLITRFKPDNRPIDAGKHLERLQSFYHRVCDDLPVASYTQVNTEQGIGNTVGQVTQICRALIEQHHVHRKPNQ